ncbi:MAG: guanidinopropionase [Oligoflexia bacterium]|nr:MAG: guanidinopropionase [Oligoflexia bacterium]
MQYKPLSGREFPRFSAIKTFFRLPHVGTQEKFDVGIFGVPYDGAVSYRPGARFAPSKVREASSLGRGFHMERGYSVFDHLKVADVGDCPIVPIDQHQTYEKIEAFADQLLKKKKRFLAVGGDHSVTLPLLRALKKAHKKPIGFIHFDAHLDTYPAAWGCEYHHGSFARHAVEEGLVAPEKMIQIGIRGPLASKDDLEFAKKYKIKVITVEDIRKGNFEAFLKKLPSFGDYPTYISYDVDILDPAYAPGTGSPVVGGLTTYEAQRIFRALKVKNLVAGDVVEINPAYDHSDITSLAGVDALFEMLCLMAQKSS